ncbi:unnamed protein product [Nippostrongylus brasiliensis]|uniref:Transposase n=1 Tax=Nippostrongylus brasiliensis TaxID=27835 RepID=A0A0N4YDW0_NIPBR|nr:unnamed protein product [Nippostrongylus brasiliensis]
MPSPLLPLRIGSGVLNNSKPSGDTPEVWIASMESTSGLQAPRNSESSYYNYKEFLSMILLAAVDGANRIMAFDLGGKGRNSDEGKT